MIRLRAFTVLELLVAMVISSLAIGASYLSYDIVYKQFLNFREVDKNVLDALTFTNVLKNDIGTGQFLYKTNNGVRIVDLQGNEYTYTFGKEQIIRNAGASRDTFHLGTSEVVYKELAVASISWDLLDKVEIMITVNGIQNKLSFHKQYGANLLMLADRSQNK